MKLVFTKKALKELHELPEKDQIFIEKKLHEWVEGENILSHPNVKNLKSLGYYRYRAGDFRIFFDIHGVILYIVKVDRRNEKTY
jgi:mRNA-degrading endonuclease RelE of RelBE toxin-antitoxin system